MVKILKFKAKTRALNLDVDDLGEIDHFSTEPISDVWPKRMRIQLLSKSKPEDYFPVGPLRLVSAAFREVCENLHVNAEFLPTQLLEKDGTRSQHQLFFCHLLENVNCFDFKRSEILWRNKRKKWIDELTKLVIDEEKATGHHLFRVDVSLFMIATSDEFSQAAKRVRLTGAVFIEPSEWSGVSC
ncbi:MAG: hypothetical protein K8U57_00135 [Planctomycetes bacterium]|nr:hypothetical protein [Planctomycetota bacterium]